MTESLSAEWFQKHLAPAKQALTSFGGKELFEDRGKAGYALATKLRKYANRSDVVILALPRGGVPVGYAVAQELNAPLDVFAVRKLGVPGHEELAMGAIASGGVRVLNEDVVEQLNISGDLIDHVARREQVELERRERLYRGGRPPLNLQDQIVILIDDGLATGSTMRAAVRALRALQPVRIVVAVPVGPRDTCVELSEEADEVVCPAMPMRFRGVGVWYRNFQQTTDHEVRELLDRAGRFIHRHAA
jgi:putative phosphoribosyl transferase